MDSPSLPLSILSILVSILLYKLYKSKISSYKNQGKITIPEPHPTWPIIGHLHLLDTRSPIHRSFSAISDKLGPVFIFRLGMSKALVVSNWEAVKECFSGANDKAFASRPSSAAGKYMGYNYAGFGFSSYYQYWREARKLAIIELLSGHRLEMLKHLRVEEVKAFVKELYGLNNEKVVVSEMFDHLTMNVMCRMIVGKKYFGGTDEFRDYQEADNFRKVIKEFMYVSGSFLVSDIIPIPFLEWLDLQGHIRSMKRIAAELDRIAEGWIDEHKQRRVEHGRSENEQDLIDVMLCQIQDGIITSEYSMETVIKATIQNLLLAGSDTTSITMTWILSLLLNSKDAMKRAQEELDQIVGRDKWVQECDIDKLVYLQAIVKETLRLYPPGPIGVPHEATQDCNVLGHNIVKGTRVFVNIWKLHRDPRIWSNPDEFIPERFLTSHANCGVSGQSFELIPFGSGRRSCPGITLALKVIHLTIASFLQGFNLSTPEDVPLDMTEGLGITLPKAVPLEVVCTPRLPHALYLQEAFD